MIYLTRLNKEIFVLNPDHIEYMEETPDTVISLASGRKIVVSEPVKEIIARTLVFKQDVYAKGPEFLRGRSDE